MANETNYKIKLAESDTDRYRAGDKNGLQSEAEQQADSRQCDVYLISSDDKVLFRAYPRTRRQIAEQA